jgi:hypothetical protein
LCQAGRNRPACRRPLSEGSAEVREFGEVDCHGEMPFAAAGVATLALIASEMHRVCRGFG